MNPMRSRAPGHGPGPLGSGAGAGPRQGPGLDPDPDVEATLVKIFTLKMPTPNIKERTSKEITAYTRGQEVTDTQSRKVTRRELSDS